MLTLNDVEQLADVIERQSGPEAAKCPRFDPKWLCAGRLARLRQAASQQFIHDDFERPPAAPRLGLYPSRNVLVEGQGRAHIMMPS